MEKYIMNIELKDNESAHGGIGFVGYTLADYLGESGIDFRDVKFGEMTMQELNNCLEESGIQSITVYDLNKAMATYVANIKEFDYWEAKEVVYHLNYLIPLAVDSKGSFKDKERYIGEMKTLKESMELISLYHRVYKE